MIFWWFVILFPAVRGSRWLFNYDVDHFVYLRTTKTMLYASLTRFDNQTERHFVIPSRCEPQATFPIRGNFGLICKQLDNNELTLFDQGRPVPLGVEAQILRVDMQTRKVALWNGHILRIFHLQANGNLGALTLELRPRTQQKITDFTIFSNKLYLLIRNIVYGVNGEGELLPMFIVKNQQNLPFQFFPSPQAEQSSILAEPHSSSVLFPLISLCEFVALLALAYWCRFRLYRSESGQITLKPMDELVPLKH